MLHSPLCTNEINQKNALELAYIGDAVYELLVRDHFIKLCASNNKSLHKKSVELVNAAAQHDAALRLMELFYDEEKRVFNRGRNAKPKGIPQGASIKQYKYATGLEAVFGYLYLQANNERIIELFEIIINKKQA